MKRKELAQHLFPFLTEKTKQDQIQA
uniref:Uncharacterized protein n=1 Tax=Anguilla anguilla TaxID=7936 RepID=A0A0E9Q186_ANGAN